jgi:hypothetical protein
MRMFFASLLCIAAVLFPALGSAEDQPVVVELFTSQGCSACPPADAQLHSLAKKPNVIALALHVDYWDYIGWEDSFAKPDFTDRQRAYAQAQNERMIYTPQFMINGMANSMANRLEEVDGLIRKYQTKVAALSLSMRRVGPSVDITLSDALYYGPYDVHLVTVSPNNTVDILTGENGGKVISYANVVTEWRTLGMWNGDWMISFQTGPLGPGKHAVLVQLHGHGEIIGSAWIN